MNNQSAFGPIESSDPRRGGGTFAGPGGPHDRAGMVVDPTNAVLLDDVHVMVIDQIRRGQSDGPALSLTLAGRINKTTERAQVMYLFDTDGAAAIISELVALHVRMGDGAFKELSQLVEARMDKLGNEGAL